MAGHRKVKQPVTNGAAKVPVIMQMEALECGAACLAMVLAYYGKWVPLEQVRSDCGVSRDGSNARNVLKAARNYGLEAAGYRYEPEDLKKEGHFPCIVHWEFNHFIVVNGIKGNMVYVNDPARGSVTMTMEQFDGGFTGVCLMFSPTEAFEPGGKQKSMIEFAKERLSGAETAVVFVVLTTIIGSLAAIIQSGFLRVFMDYLLPGYNPEWVMPFLLALTGLSILQIAAAWIQAVYSLRINGKMAVVGSTSYLWKVLHLPMEFFTQRMAGDIQLRQGTNETIANDIVNTVAPLAMNTVMMIFYLVVMIRYSPLLTLVGILTVVLNTWVSRIIAKKRVNITRVMMRDEGKLASVKVSGIEMIETIKSSGAENGYFEKWSGYQASVNAQRVKYQKLDAYLGMIPMFLNALAGAAVLIIGVGLCIKGNFSVGMIMAFQGFMTRFTAPADELINASRTIQEMRTQMERVGDVMEYPEDKAFKKEDLKEDEEYGKLSGSISMKNVTFGYSKLAEPLIENFNLELKPGSRVAFVGASGCGKSTLSKLISGLYEPWSGEILFDGKPMNEIDRGVFTGSVAVVDQDIILFEDTIANNIKMWDNSIEDFEMILAARDAQIHEDIMVRDGGYRYKITEGGQDFSGGQRQRLEIARVLAQDPTVIIMDEATSALDARTEYEVTKAIKDRGITCVVIAHRLSTIRDCDEIVVLDRGKVLERGTHEELMKNNGAYTRLVTVE